MLSRLARLILAFVCYPLLGAYGLRWAGRFATEVFATVGLTKVPLISLLDLVGAVIGGGIGVWFAAQLAASCCQSRNRPLQATGDVLLLVLTGLFLADALLPPLLAQTGLGSALAPLTLVVWLATGAATLRLAHLRRRAPRSRMREEVEAEPAGEIEG